MTIHASNLKLDGVRIQNKAARQVAQSLSPIDGPAPWRDVNGSLRISSRVAVSHKFRSSISGVYMLPPELGGVWIGKVLEVECVADIIHTGKAGAGERERPAVDGSVIFEGMTGSVLTGDPAPELVARTRYRPVLTMMVVGFNSSSSEHAAETSWSIDLEEV